MRTRGPDLLCRVYLRRRNFRQSFAVEGSVEVVVVQFCKWESLSKAGVTSELTRERQFGRLGQGAGRYGDGDGAVTVQYRYGDSTEQKKGVYAVVDGVLEGGVVAPPRVETKTGAFVLQKKVELGRDGGREHFRRTEEERALFFEPVVETMSTSVV